MVQDEMAMEEEVGGLPTGAIAAAAVAAGIVAFMIRRARRAEEERMQRPLDRATMAWDRLRETDVRAKTAAATRDFMVDRVLPEFKPILLDLLKDVRAYVDTGFKRVEKAIKDL